MAAGRPPSRHDPVSPDGTVSDAETGCSPHIAEDSARHTPREAGDAISSREHARTQPERASEQVKIAGCSSRASNPLDPRRRGATLRP